MQVTFNSKERTLREIVKLALSAGWRVTKVTRTQGGSLFAHIIAVPVDIPVLALTSALDDDEEMVEGRGVRGVVRNVDEDNVGNGGSGVMTVVNTSARTTDIDFEKPILELGSGL